MMVFGKSVYSDDFKPEEDIIKRPNSLYRKVEWNQPKQYWYLKDHWYLKKGRSEYTVWEIRFFNQDGVVYKSRGFYQKSYLQNSHCCVFFNDVSQIPLKRKVNYSMNVPFIMSERESWFRKGAQAVLYVPIRYLDEMGYRFEEETTHNIRFNYRYKKELVTPYFRLLAEEKEWTDYNKQKQALLKRLKELKDTANADRRDIIEAVRHTTDIYIRS